MHQPDSYDLIQKGFLLMTGLQWEAASELLSAPNYKVMYQ